MFETDAATLASFVRERGVPNVIDFPLQDALARYALTDRATLSVNATNLLDQGYYRNVRFAFGGPGGFYGEPRRVIGSVRVSF